MFLYDPPSIPPSQGGRLKADTFTAHLACQQTRTLFTRRAKATPYFS